MDHDMAYGLAYILRHATSFTARQLPSIYARRRDLLRLRPDTDRIIGPTTEFIEGTRIMFEVHTNTAVESVILAVNDVAYDIHDIITGLLQNGVHVSPSPLIFNRPYGFQCNTVVQISIFGVHSTCPHQEAIAWKKAGELGDKLKLKMHVGLSYTNRPAWEASV